MKATDFFLNNWRYLGSLLHGRRFPPREPGVYRADLHAHPFIRSTFCVRHLLRVLRRRQIDLLGLTSHGPGGPKERDFEVVKEMCRGRRWGGLTPEDAGLCLRWRGPEERRVIIGAYENYCRIPGVRGYVDFLALMPDPSYWDRVEQLMPFDEILGLARECRAIAILTHPFTRWNPGEFLRFGMPDEDERLRLQETVFPKVDGVDEVATNCAWMVLSDRVLRESYPGRTLCNSDSHARILRRFTRRTIGLAGNLFRLDLELPGEELREQLRRKIRAGDFETYYNYMTPAQFLLSVVIPAGDPRFP